MSNLAVTLQQINRERIIYHKTIGSGNELLCKGLSVWHGAGWSGRNGMASPLVK